MPTEFFVLPGTHIRVLTPVEAVRKRPSFYGLTEEDVATMSDDELEAYYEETSARYTKAADERTKTTAKGSDPKTPP